MANPRKTQTFEPWGDDRPDPSWDTDLDDNELLLDEFSDDEIVNETGHVDRLNDLAPWRLIEIARENKYLRSAIADFDEYDELEYFGDDLPAEYSH
jgi:hypothetical protein